MKTREAHTGEQPDSVGAHVSAPRGKVETQTHLAQGCYTHSGTGQLFSTNIQTYAGFQWTSSKVWNHQDQLHGQPS